MFFTIYEALFQNIMKVLFTIYQNKTKTPGKIGIVWFSYKRQYVICTIFGGTVSSLFIKWIYLSQCPNICSTIKENLLLYWGMFLVFAIAVTI